MVAGCSTTHQQTQGAPNLLAKDSLEDRHPKPLRHRLGQNGETTVPWICEAKGAKQCLSLAGSHLKSFSPNETEVLEDAADQDRGRDEEEEYASEGDLVVALISEGLQMVRKQIDRWV